MQEVSKSPSAPWKASPPKWDFAPPPFLVFLCTLLPTPPPSPALSGGSGGRWVRGRAGWQRLGGEQEGAQE